MNMILSPIASQSKPLQFVVGGCLGYFDSESECTESCVGDRDNDCIERSVNDETKFACSCQASYFSNEESCERECGALYWSWFTYGACTDKVNEGICSMTCGWRVRVWATVFIIVLFAAAVCILVCILPMCVSSCKACLMIKKEEKRKKKAQYAVDNYAASYDGGSRGREIIPAVSKPGSAYYYNPYAYYSYGRM